MLSRVNLVSFRFWNFRAWTCLKNEGIRGNDPGLDPMESDIFPSWWFNGPTRKTTVHCRSFGNVWEPWQMRCTLEVKEGLKRSQFRWWQLHYFIFARKLGKMNPFWRSHIVQMGWSDHQAAVFFKPKIKFKVYKAHSFWGDFEVIHLPHTCYFHSELLHLHL